MTGVNSCGSIRLLTIYPARGCALQMCLPAARVARHIIQSMQLVFLKLHFIQECFGCLALSDDPRCEKLTVRGRPHAEEAGQERRRRTWGRDEREGAGRAALWRTDPHWDLCHVPLRSKQKREPGRGERRKRMQNWEGAEWNSHEQFLPFPPG